MSVYNRNAGTRQEIEIPKNYSGIYFAPAREAPSEPQKVHRAADSPPPRTLVSRARDVLPGRPLPEPEPEEMPENEPFPPVDTAEPEEKVISSPRKETGEGQRSLSGLLGGLDAEELLIAGLLIVLLREGAGDWLPLSLALLLA